MSENTQGVVISMALYSVADNWDVVPYRARSLGLGFHRVDWRGDWYLLIPRWACVAAASLLVACALWLAHRMRDNQPLQRTGEERTL